MTDIADLIESFYSDVWVSGNVEDAERVLHPRLRFRGSIGEEKQGLDGFWEYFNLIRGAFGEYQCEILELVADGDQAAAKIRFSGFHRRVFLGVEATGRNIAWKGTAFFKMKDDMLFDIWVLGDTDGLRAALGGAPAEHQVEVYWSLQSTYCYFLTQRLYELSLRADVDVHLKPVRPGVLRLPDAYRDRSTMEMAYFDRDAERTAAYLDLPFAEPKPSPVAFKKGKWVAKARQPRIDKLQRMLMVAVNEGKGQALLYSLMHNIWSGQIRGWDKDETLDETLIFADLGPDHVRKKIAKDAEALDAQILQNEQDMYAAGHWGVPLMVYRGEAFYGQDRFDQLLWRIEEN